MQKQTKIIFYDGSCGFCNASVQFILKRDKKKQFQFAALQSQTALATLPFFGINPKGLSSIVYLRNNRAYQKSTAVLLIVGGLKGAWPLLQGFFIVPAFIRDWFYGIIATNRYRIAGKQNACLLPSEEELSRFLK